MLIYKHWYLLFMNQC